MERKVARADLAKTISVRKAPDIDFLLRALQILPQADQRWVTENVFYFSTYGKTYGSRMSRGLCQAKEIIYLSEKLFPIQFDLTSWNTRFFVLIVLHETAHAKRQHKCRVYDGISDTEYDRQEREATSDAIGWFNRYASENGIEPLNVEEEAESKIKLDRLVDDFEVIWGTHLKTCLEKMKGEVQ